MSASALESLAALLRAEGGLLAAAVVEAPPGEAPHGERAAAGPRARGHELEFALLVEAMREGYLQHYGQRRVLECRGP